MKFMKLGTRPDSFYSEAATRTVLSDVPGNIVICIDNVSYLLHKFQLLPKCGLLQHLCPESGDSNIATIELHDVPGGAEAFELCAKFCYGMTINISAHNLVPALCAAKFLRMTEAVEKGNLVLKLEAFLHSCILVGWKDSIVTLQSTLKLPEWSENLGIVRKCIDSIVEKILTPHSKVSWSYTYTRPGYTKKNSQSVPKDWWTEDLSDLDIELFRCIILAVRSTYILPPQLIGEALHVYACRWLPDTANVKPSETKITKSKEDLEKNRQILEKIVGMIPSDRGSVSVGFLLRLLNIANYLAVSSTTKTELIRRSSLQFEEAKVSDLLFPSQSTSNTHFYDVDSVVAVLECLRALWRRQYSGAAENSHFLRYIRKVGKLVDSYLRVVVMDINMPVSKVIQLVEALPDIARPNHDDLYKAINMYLKEHPDLSKADKKRLCRILDCQKLSSEVRAHAVKNERLPLRTVVQVLFFDQEQAAITTDNHGKLKPDIDNGVEKEARDRTGFSEISERDGHRTRRTDVKLLPAAEKEMKDDRSEFDVKSVKSSRTREMSREIKTLSKSESKKMVPKGSRSEHGGEQRQVKR
ncbi:BTB/POZ domain-containing protein At5g47800 [Cucurbita pepo subsp. pepo]|uniref:BTB/POZ domain-containing protein At5g47800 n=1 Tax=Cucurbita pepo subsp. pepo TaxID=3664 RepID=UPI000C9D4AA2|nr:BTB/POZ domain-containing protein At5g47800 [Cucurbita pepo subsp. pepo]XP_023543839.1 BTB/POZ domain-containing protein At5g47800 [Cucurbita pepo subsp. pepo]XP_023543840.1 BTB/POZ domain-containing protein At5g47800 [Cucurbita pepo subsp. pepo]XP_023543841.1 BTB/POZ domain-containing protein At5g47800 [Cucurbita pepo subsp. pepo]